MTLFDIETAVGVGVGEFSANGVGVSRVFEVVLGKGKIFVKCWGIEF